MSIFVKSLGHASFEIKADGKVIYADPYQGEYQDKADLILISHSHFDHCDPSKIKRILKEGTLIIAPADCASKIGRSVKSLKPGEKISVDNITVQAVEAYNYKRFRSPGAPFHPKGLGVGYLLIIGGKTIYHAGDTDFIPEMKNLKNIYLALLPCDGTYTMDSSEVVEAALAINPQHIIPMHSGETNLERIKKEVETKSKIKVVLLRPVEQFEIE
jgi:L-ascorbate metabolism protein UlaG (beta-lactamase superfamily)